MDLWVGILIAIAVPFLFIIARTIYKLLNFQEDIEDTVKLTLSEGAGGKLLKETCVLYSKELDLEEALSSMTETIIESISVSSSSFLISAAADSKDYLFKSHLVYEVPEEYVNQELEVLKQNLMEEFEVEIEDVSRNIEGGPVNESSTVKAKSRVIFPIEIGELKGTLCITSRKEEYFSEDLEAQLRDLFKEVTEYLSLVWQVAQREHRKFKAMVDSMREGVFMVDEEYRFLIVNPALKEMMGIHSSSAMNIINASNFFALHLSVEDAISEVFVMGKIKKFKDLNLKDRFYALTLIPVKVGNYVIGVVGLLEDQTHEKELEQMRQDFSAMIIHELRSPLTVIRSTSDFIIHQSEALTEKEKIGFLNSIENSATELLALVNNLLDSAKIESGRIELFKSVTDLNTLIDDQVKYYSNSFVQKGVHLDSKVADSLPELYVDSDKIRQVLNNLISNALKYTPEGGKVVVESQLINEQVRFYVIDSGEGIPDDNKEKIFEKYKRVEKKTKEKGTGLGLAISKGIVEAHNGKIWVEDNHPHGSKFIVELPVTS